MMNSKMVPQHNAAQQKEKLERRAQALAELMSHVMALYTCGGSSSVSELEGYSLIESVCYVLGIESLEADSAGILECDDLLAVFHEKCRLLDQRADALMLLWQDVCLTMPQINNIALRDTLSSIGDFKRNYSTLFAAHEVPCNIDYPLSRPVSEQLKGIDYLEAWLEQLYQEAQFLSCFELDDCIRILEQSCPDYKGLLINLKEPILMAQQAGEIHRVKRWGSMD